MTTATNRFTTSTPLFTVDNDTPLPAGLIIIAIEREAGGSGLGKVIYALPESPEHHKTCRVSEVMYNALRHEQNRK